MYVHSFYVVLHSREKRLAAFLMLQSQSESLTVDIIMNSELHHIM